MRLLGIALALFSQMGCMPAEPGPSVDRGNPPAPIIPRDNPYGFSLNFLKSVPFSATGNTLLSPLSVEMAMSGLVPGMGGDDQSLLLRTLSPGLSASELMKQEKGILGAMNRADSPIQVANSVWVSKLIQAKPDYLRTLADSLNSEVKSFSASPASVKKINDWVDAKTKGRIPEIIDSLRPEDVLLLMNAVAFDGKWKTEFDPKLTTSQEFHAPGGSVQVPMMHLKAEMPFSVNSSVTALKLPYQGGEFSMLVLLPAGGDPAALLKSLPPAGVRSLSATEASGEVTIAIPKFKFTNSFMLKGPLSSMGLAKLFQSADFSGISPELKSGQISKVIHKTFIEVDEKGTKAAAATGVMVRPTMVRVNEPTFIADRPFAFLILHEPTSYIVFAGVVNNPNSSG